MAEIRPAQAADHSGAIGLWREAGLGTLTEAEWHAVIDRPTSILLVAEEDAEIIGAVIAAFDGWRAYIYHVAVAPAHRQHGLARRLMSAAETLLAQAGAQRVFAMVHQENPAGLALSAIMGYEPEGEVILVKELEETEPAG